MILAVLLALAGTLSTPAPAQEEEKVDYAILIVGDEGDAEMLRREKVLIQEMAKTIRKQDPDERLPIFSYHFNKERERAYCEKRLNVLKEDLLFVGVVRLKDKVPRKVVYRIDRINNPARAAGDVLARAEELAHPALADAGVEDPGTEPTASPSPSPSPDGSPVAAAGPGWRIQLGSYTQLKYAEEQANELQDKGYDATIDRSVTNGTQMFKVTIGTYTDQDDAKKAVEALKKEGFENAFLVEVPGTEG